jgi:hypothetical protein
LCSVREPGPSAGGKPLGVKLQEGKLRIDFAIISLAS